MMHGRFISAAVLAGVLAAAGAAQADILVDFNGDASDFTSNFNGPAGNYAWASTVGVNGTGGLDVVNASGSPLAWYTADTFNLDNAPTVSMFFKLKDNASNEHRALGLGFAKANGSSVLLGVRANVTAAEGLRFRYEYPNSATGTALGFDSGTYDNLIIGNWYKLSVTVADLNNANQFDLSAMLQDYGTDGTSLVGTVRTLAPITLTSGDTGFSDLTSVYAAFRADDTRGADALDNFAVTLPTAIPEPASVGLLALGGLALLGRRR